MDPKPLSLERLKELLTINSWEFMTPMVSELKAHIDAQAKEIELLNLISDLTTDLAAARLQEMTRLGLENARLREVVEEIAFKGTDIPAAAGGGVEAKAGFYKGQLYDCIRTAARVLSALSRVAEKEKSDAKTEEE